MVVSLALTILPSFSWAELPAPTTGPVPALTAPSTTLASLWDPRRFSMQHSYTWAMSSDGKHTTAGGLYLNTMQYQISTPLLLRLKWGVSQLPAAGSEPGAHFKQQFVLPEVELWYRPSANFVMRFECSSSPLLFDHALYPQPSRLTPFGE
jgi:hypothetical protein